MSIAAGAPSTAKVAHFTGGNVARAVSLTIILTIITVILTPFLVPFILEGAEAHPLSVMANLVVMILIPLVLGIIVKSRSEPLLPHQAGRGLGLQYLDCGHLPDLWRHLPLEDSGRWRAPPLVPSRSLWRSFLPWPLLI